MSACHIRCNGHLLFCFTNRDGFLKVRAAAVACNVGKWQESPELLKRSIAGKVVWAVPFGFAERLASGAFTASG